jgi:hypothetical protein
MTRERAKQIYISAGGNPDHSESEWNNVHKEMEGVVSEKSDRMAAKHIVWWACWDRNYTATAFARRVRAAMGKEKV